MSDVEKTIQRGLVCLLVLSPLLFGTVEFWSLAIMEVTCIALVFLWCSRQLRSESAVSFIEPPFLLPAGLLLGLAIMQVVPMPPSFVQVLSPQTYRLYSENLPYVGGLPWLTLSLYPHATLLEIVRFVACLSVYCLAVQVLRDRLSITGMSTALVITGACSALLGIFQRIFWNGKLLWFRELSQGGQPFGSYVNKNHFAGLMEMLIPVCMGYLIYLLPGIRNDHDFRNSVSDFFSHRRANRAILVSATTVVMITSLFLSLSRGGIIGLSLSMLLFGFLLLGRDSTKRKGRTIIALFLIVLFTVGWFGWKPVIERFEKMGQGDISSGYRMHHWKDSLHIIGEFPFFGTGLGTYDQIYPRYKTVPMQGRWEHAHNDYLEGAAELGIPGLLLILFIMGFFYKKMFLVLRMRRSLFSRLLGIGAVSGVTGIMVHSVTDFNMHVGANGLHFFLLMGFAVAVSHAGAKEGKGGTLLRVREIAVSHHMRKRLLLGLKLICMLFCAIPLSNVSGEIFHSLARGPLDEPDALALKGAMLAKAAVLSPFDARLPFAEGTIDYALGKRAETVASLERAVARNPVNSEYLQLLGVAYGNVGENDKAVKYMRLAALYNPTSAWVRKNYSLWLFSRGQKEDAIKEMREAITLDPDRTRKYIFALALSRLSPNEIREVIPENSSALLLYGRFREEKGDPEEALEGYLSALDVMKRSGEARTNAYQKITGLYEKEGRLDQALAFYEEGVQYDPSDYGLRVGLARLYERLNMVHRAKEEYKKVLALHPSDKFASGRIEEIERKVPGDTSALPDNSSSR